MSLFSRQTLRRIEFCRANCLRSNESLIPQRHSTEGLGDHPLDQASALCDC
jgi:hypothetical protein